MKNILSILFCVLFLCGCTSNAFSTQEELEKRLTTAENRPADAANYNHGLYSYYCPSDIGRVESFELGNLFCMDQVQFAMNLNVPAIINKTYYQDIEVSTGSLGTYGDLIAEYESNYTDAQGDSHAYCVKIAKAGSKVLVTFESDVLQFLGSGNELECTLLSGQMLRIAKSVKVDEATVNATYSNRTMITYVRKKVDLFQNVAPESGAIEELFETGHETSEEAGNDYDGDNFGPAQRPQQTDDPEQQQLEEIKSNKH